MSEPKPKTLTAGQAKALATLTAIAGKAKAAFEAATQTLNEKRAAYKPLIPPSTLPADEGKDVRQIVAGRWRVRVSTYQSHETFSLKDYRAAGLPITPEMAQHIHPGSTKETWTIKDLTGPTLPGAVEPS